jgi:hypothetical protein
MENMSYENIAYALRGIAFPASNEDLSRQAKRNKADPEVIELIQHLPDLNYNSLAEVKRIVQANAEFIYSHSK